MDFKLKQQTSQSWLDTVLNDFDGFLCDHASCEKKASGMAMSMLSHYPDQPELVMAMANLALEELQHFKQVLKLILARGLQPVSDSKDVYIQQLHKAMGKGKSAYLLNRLLIASIVEARGAERFEMIAQALPQGELKVFYEAISASERRHYLLFLQLAESHCHQQEIPERLDALLDIEAEIVKNLPLKAALH